MIEQLYPGDDEKTLSKPYYRPATPDFRISGLDHPW